MKIEERIGVMDRRINVQAVTTTVNGQNGQRTKQYNNTHAIWANVEYKDTGVEEVTTKSGPETSSQKVIFTIRHIANLTKEHRVSFDSKFYDIEGITEMTDRGRKRYLQLHTKLVE